MRLGGAGVGWGLTQRKEKKEKREREGEGSCCLSRGLSHLLGTLGGFKTCSLFRFDQWIFTYGWRRKEEEEWEGVFFGICWTIFSMIGFSD